MSAAVEHLGRYELLLELAKGGMAELYLARLHGAGGFEKIVAIKRILPHLAEDKLFVEMFLNEGKIASRIVHENVCEVFELGEADGELFLVMEYLDGVPWDALIKELPRTPETLRLVAGVFSQACEGLHHAHELKDVDGSPTPVIHRDVSPQNLFVTTSGVCKVLDFGVSKMMKDGPRTRTGVLKGKLPYMSPEQIQAEPLDARSDVFALGVCIWEALTGTGLFDRETDFLIWKAITEEPVPPLVPRGFPPAIDAVLGSALDRNKDRRFRSVRALGEALRRAAETVGGAYTREQIAAVVQERCGDKLAERAREVRSVVTGRRSKPALDEPTAADTIEDKAGSTVSLRPESVKVKKPADRAPAPARRRWPLIAGAVAVAVAIPIVIALTRTSETTPPPAPPASDMIAIDGSGLCPRGRTCALTCATGSCNVVCEGTCTASCAGGRCDQRCTASGRCTFDCGGGSCNQDCTAGACTATCTGGTCTIAGVTVAQPTPPPPPPTKPVAAGPPVSKPVTAPKPKQPPVVVEEAYVGTGTFSIDSTPFARIYLDGNWFGETPLQNIEVEAGTHRVKAVNDEDHVQSFTIVIKKGQHTNHGRLTW